MKKFIYAFLIIFLFSFYCYAINIKAFVNKDHISKEDYVKLTVQLPEKGNIDISPIKNFYVISQGTSSNMQIINGKISQNFSYNYTLLPLETGKLKIPSITVRIDNNTYKTKPISIFVSNQNNLNLESTKKNKDIFVTASISNNNAYEGQQLIYTFKLFHMIQITNAQFIKPSFSGFTAKEIEGKKPYDTIISGKRYRVNELSYALVPQKIGKFAIEPSKLECSVVTRVKNRRRGSSGFDSFFDDSFFTDSFFGNTKLVPKIFKTKSINVNVNPLPKYTAKHETSGLVGKFNISAKIKNTKINVGDSVTLSIKISGNGNIIDATEPKINISDAFKVYKDNPVENISVGPNGYSGNKIFKFALVAVKPGKYSIKPIRLCYFDINKKKYISRYTKPILITIEKGEKQVVSSFSSNTFQKKKKIQKKNVEFIGRDILPLKQSATILKNYYKMSLILFLCFIIIPIIICLIIKLFLILFLKKDISKNIMIKRADLSLKKAKLATNSSEEFFSLLYLALISKIFAKANIQGESLTYLEAKQILLDNGCCKNTANLAYSLLMEIEQARYSGKKMDDNFKKELFLKTKKLIGSLS